jgi:hypothetical protein
MSDDARDPAPKPKRMKMFTTSDPSDPGDGDGGPSMIEIDEDPRDERLNRSDPTADIKAFFTLAPHEAGQSKRHMKCNPCA